VLAFALRGGATFSLFGIRVRNRLHARASRWRCMLRAIVVCLPILPVFITALLGSAAQLAHLVIAGAITLVLYGGGAVWSLLRPNRGPADILAGTRLVPR
jgi:hypothetical protein